LSKALVEGLFPGFAADPHIGGVELPGVADRCIDNRVLTAAIRLAMRPLDDRLNLRGRDRKREHADASISTRGIGASSVPMATTADRGDKGNGLYGPVA
jgi:hypothetical protein